MSRTDLFGCIERFVARPLDRQQDQAATGEKIAEELSHNMSGVTRTAHPKILRAKRSPNRAMERPEKPRERPLALDAGNIAAIRRIHLKLVSG